MRHVANDLQHGRETFLLFSDIIVFLHLDLDLGRIYAAEPRIFSEINIVFSAAVSFRWLKCHRYIISGTVIVLFTPSIYLIVARIFGNLLNLAEYFLTEFLSSNFLSLFFLAEQKYSWKVRRGVFTNDLLPVV